MTKTRILTILVVVMVLLNVVTVAFLFWGRGHGPKHPHPNHEGPRNIIIEQLKLDEKQVAAYDALIKVHRKAIAQQDSLMQLTRNNLYAQLLENDSLAVATQFESVGALAKRVEEIHFNHFLRLKALCTPEQLPAFEKLTTELVAHFSTSKPPPPKH